MIQINSTLYIYISYSIILYIYIEYLNQFFKESWIIHTLVVSVRFVPWQANVFHQIQVLVLFYETITYLWTSYNNERIWNKITIKQWFVSINNVVKNMNFLRICWLSHWQFFSTREYTFMQPTIRIDSNGTIGKLTNIRSFRSFF